MDSSITFSGQENTEKSSIHLREWLHNISLLSALEQTEQHIRQQPESLKWRSIYLEILCVLRKWDRALKALDMYIKMNPGQKANLGPMERLIRAELVRESIFAGKESPKTLYPAPSWMEPFTQALQQNALQAHEIADELRSAALAAMEQDPDFIERSHTGLEGNLGHCEWLVDSDSRLSAVLECVCSEGYRWIPLYEIVSFQTAAPTSLLDLIWLPAEIRVRQQSAQTLKVYIPVRYPALDGQHENDSILLAKMTQWVDYGLSSVFAIGQKTFITDQKDWPLLETRSWQQAQKNQQLDA